VNIKDKIDVRDNTYIWCVGEVKKITGKEVTIHYVVLLSANIGMG